VGCINAIVGCFLRAVPLNGTQYLEQIIYRVGHKKTVPYIILFKMLLHLFIRTKWHTIWIASLFCTYWCQNL